MAYIFLFISIACNAAGQILMKFAADDLNFETTDKIAMVKDAALNPFIIGGISLYVIGLVAWLLTLSRLELSTAYPFLALTYIVVTVLSFVIFNEAVTSWKLAGIGLIFVGIVVLGYGLSQQS